MLWLVLAVAALLSLSHSVIYPLTQWWTPLLELRGWAWVSVLVIAFLLAGQPD